MPLSYSPDEKLEENVSRFRWGRTKYPVVSLSSPYTWIGIQERTN